MYKLGILLLTLVVSVPILSYAKQANYPASQEALEKEVANLEWETEASSYLLSKSRSSLELPPDLTLLRGDDAERLMFLSEAVERPDVEAVVLNISNSTQVVFSYQDSGYVSIDDWNELNADNLLEEIKKNTEIANREKIKHGLPEIHVRNWLVKPSLDKEKDAVHWAILAVTDGENMVNAVTLKLGRNGFESLVWIGTERQISSSDGTLDTMLKAHKFNQGFRYADFSVGDKIAAFGIASLVAVSAGGKSKTAKSTITAIGIAIMAFIKKFIIVPISLALSGFWALLKKPFSRKSSDKST